MPKLSLVIIASVIIFDFFPSTLSGMVKLVPAFGLSNNKMAMVDVDDSSYRRTHSPSRLAWSEGWRPPGAQSAFII